MCLVLVVLQKDHQGRHHDDAAADADQSTHDAGTQADGQGNPNDLWVHVFFHFSKQVQEVRRIVHPIQVAPTPNKILATT